MADFDIRSEAIDVEQIMEQIRARIRDKRGVDYTEEQIRELAAIKLEKFIDPRGIRSDLLERFRQVQTDLGAPPNYVFEEDTLYATNRAAIRWIRTLLRPILKLFFNPNPLIQALNIQSRLNTMNAARRELDHLHFEVIHNLVVEMTRLGIEAKNLKMRVEALASRLDFSERRARALESVVVYKPSSEDARELPVAQGVPRTAETRVPAPASQGPGPATFPHALASPAVGLPAQEGPGQRSRRRRRRRGRRRGAPMAPMRDETAAQTPQPGLEATAPSGSTTPTESTAAREQTSGADSRVSESTPETTAPSPAPPAGQTTGGSKPDPQ